MKELLAGVVLLALVGICAFLYRNTVERPGVTASEVACTLEAKICPDGMSVGRSGPSCNFSACAYPNVEVADKGVAFVVPEGYAPDEQAYGADPTLIAAFTKTGNNRLVVRSYPIAEGESGDDVILAYTRYQPADEGASDFSRFEPVLVNGKTYQATVIERFEGMVESSYFLVREGDVLRFDVVEQNVLSWMEPTLDVSTLPEHQALRSLLATLQAAP